MLQSSKTQLTQDHNLGHNSCEQRILWWHDRSAWDPEPLWAKVDQVRMPANCNRVSVHCVLLDSRRAEPETWKWRHAIGFSRQAACCNKSTRTCVALGDERFCCVADGE